MIDRIEYKERQADKEVAAKFQTGDMVTTTVLQKSTKGATNENH